MRVQGSAEVIEISSVVARREDGDDAPMLVNVNARDHHWAHGGEAHA
jgi:hypothetical protein